jgi:hypothetical protein
MATTIREADITRDRDELIRFLGENLAAGANASRFDWLYLRNPCGRARAWMALGEAGETIGMAAAFPRDFWITDRAEQVWVLGDFCIAKEHRSLGPALSLQRVITRECEICYDFPSQSMLSIYRRLGVPAFGQHVRYVKLLKADEKVQKFVRQRFLASPLIQIGNWTLALGRMAEFVAESITFSLHEDEFGEEFQVLDSGTSPHPVKGLRSADYLNWRYAQHPIKPYRVITARRQSELIGYTVVEVDGPHAMIADLRTTDPENVVPGMLAYIQRVLVDMGAHSINASLFEGCYLVPYIRRAGFHPRESAPVIAYARNNSKSLSGIHDPKNWLLLYGDRDS